MIKPEVITDALAARLRLAGLVDVIALEPRVSDDEEYDWIISCNFRYGPDDDSDGRNVAFMINDWPVFLTLLLKDCVEFVVRGRSIYEKCT